VTKTLCSILVGALATALLVAAAGPSSAAVQTQGFESAMPTGWTVRNNSEPKVIARAKKDLAAASKKGKAAKRTLAVATGRLATCQGG